MSPAQLAFKHLAVTDAAFLLPRSPHKSSLLQIFVSIQGLVLVREPYFTEPAFEKLRGTKEARVSSRQYKCDPTHALSRSGRHISSSC